MFDPLRCTCHWELSEALLSTPIAYSIAFFSVAPRVVLVMGYMAEFRFYNPKYLQQCSNRKCQK